MRWTSDGATLEIARAALPLRGERVSKVQVFPSAPAASPLLALTVPSLLRRGRRRDRSRHRHHRATSDLSPRHTSRIPVTVSPRGFLVQVLDEFARRESAVTALSVVAKPNDSATTTTTFDVACDSNEETDVTSGRSIFSGAKA